MMAATLHLGLVSVALSEPQPSECLCFSKAERGMHIFSDVASALLVHLCAACL